MPEPDLTLLQRLLVDQLEKTTREGDALKSGGGGGTSGGMEARVARLESDMEHVKKSVAEIATDMKAVRTSINDVKVDLGRFDERLKVDALTANFFLESGALPPCDAGAHTSEMSPVLAGSM